MQFLQSFGGILSESSARRSGSILRAIPLLFLLFIFGSWTTAAQTPTTSPTPSAEELRLIEEKRLTELRRDIELAQKAIRDAQPQPPAPTATPLAGDTTLENVKLEPEMVAYKALSQVAATISTEIKTKRANAKNIAIYDGQTVRDWRFYQALFPAFRGQVDDLRERYRALLCTDANIKRHVDAQFFAQHCAAPTSTDPRFLGVGDIQAAFGAGTTLLKSFIDLAALFRTDTKIQGVAFTIDESALVAEIFRALRNEYGADNIKLYYPEVFPPRVEDQSATVTMIGDIFLFKIEADNVIKDLNDENAARNRQIAGPLALKNQLEAQLAQLEGLNKKLANLEAALRTERNAAARRKIREEIAATRAEIARFGETEASLKAKIDAQKLIIKPLQDQVDLNTADVKRLTELNARFLAFVNEFVKLDANGINALALFIKSEDIENAMRDPESYWLEIKSVSAGGTNRTRKNLIRYFTGAKLDHSGGVIAEYTLYDKTGAAVASDKISVYEGYIEPKVIRNRERFRDIVP